MKGILMHYIQQVSDDILLTEPCLPASQSYFTRQQRYQMVSALPQSSEEGHWRCLCSALTINVCALVSKNKSLTEQVYVSQPVCAWMCLCVKNACNQQISPLPLRHLSLSRFTQNIFTCVWNKESADYFDNRVKQTQSYYLRTEWICIHCYDV